MVPSVTDSPPQVVALDSSVVQPLLDCLDEQLPPQAIEIVDTLATAVDVVSDRSPAVVVLPADTSWRALTAEVAVVLVDPDNRLSVDRAVDAGVAEYLDTLDDARLRLAARRVKSLTATGDQQPMAERRAETLFETPGMFAGLLDTDGRLQWVNDAALSFIDAELGDVAGEPFWELPWWDHSVADQKRVRAAVRRAVSGGTVRFEAANYGADGERRRFDVSVRPITDKDGEVREVVVQGIDVTEADFFRRELDEVLDRITDGVFALDTDWRITYLNSRSEVLTQKSAADLRGQVFWEAFSEEMKAPYEQQMRQAMETQEVSTFEAYYDPLDSWFEVRLFPSETGLSIYYRDITEQRQSTIERKLLQETIRITAEAESFERALDEVINVLCSRTELVYGEAWIPAEDDYLAFHPRLSEDAAAPPADSLFAQQTSERTFTRGEGLPGRVWVDNEPKWIPDIAAADDEEFARRDIVTDMGYQAALGVPITAGSEVVAVLALFLPTPQPRDERLVELVSSVATEVGGVMVRKRAHDALERERKLLERVFETSPVGIVVTNADGEMIDSNEQFRQIVDVTQAELSTRTFSDEKWQLTDSRGRPIEPEALPIGKVLQTGESVTNSEHGIKRGDGERRWLRVNAEPLFDYEGTVEYVVTAVQDITEERRRGRRLRRQREQLSVMDRILRHDLRTHANVALGTIERLRDGDIGIDEGTETVLSHIESLLSTAGKTRKVTQLSGYQASTATPMTAIFGRSLTELGRRLDDPSVTVSADGLDAVFVDVTEGFHLALVELLENAAEHAETAPVSLTGQVTDDGDAVEIRIRDDGPGISELELRVLAVDEETPLVHSRGIGIWLARWLVTENGGELTIHRLDDGGTESCIRLPVVDEETASGAIGTANRDSFPD